MKERKNIKTREFFINFMKNKRGILLLILLISSLFLISCTKKGTLEIDNGEEKISINVEYADTKEKMERGLMFRESLDENAGMFFAFDKEYQYTFWMKNTLIPLDVIFISKNFNIVDIIPTEPCKEDPCQSYKPKVDSQYVLEVNSGFTAKNNIKIGDEVIVDEGAVEKMVDKIYKG